MTIDPHPCLGCGRTTVGYGNYCAMCQSGYVRPDLVGIMRWHRGKLVPVEPEVPELEVQP